MAQQCLSEIVYRKSYGCDVFSMCHKTWICSALELIKDVVLWRWLYFYLSEQLLDPPLYLQNIKSCLRPMADLSRVRRRRILFVKANVLIETWGRRLPLKPQKAKKAESRKAFLCPRFCLARSTKHLAPLWQVPFMANPNDDTKHWIIYVFFLEEDFSEKENIVVLLK